MTLVIMPYFTSKHTVFFSLDNNRIPTLNLPAVTSTTRGSPKLNKEGREKESSEKRIDLKYRENMVKKYIWN